MLREKIRKWNEEIETISKKQKEMARRNNERIRELQKKIQDANEKLLLEENQKIADTVREIYGDMTPEKLEDLKNKMKQLQGNEMPTEEEGWPEHPDF